MKPHFQLEPISISSSGLVRSKTINKRDFPLVRAGEIIILSTKITNIGGKFEYHKQFTVHLYLDDTEGNAKVIAKQFYGTPDGIIFNHGDVIPVSFDIETTNLGPRSSGLSSIIRRFSIAILKTDFVDCTAENMPLFTDKQKAELEIYIDSWFPEFRIMKLTTSSSSPREGDTIILGCYLKNVGRAPLYFQLGTLKLAELAADGRTILKTHFPNAEFVNPIYSTLVFDSGNSNEGQECKSLSFDFIPISDVWLDSIIIKREAGTSSQITCSIIKISYQNYPITSSDINWDRKTGIHYLNYPVFLEGGRSYHFEFDGITGSPMLGNNNYRIGKYEVIKNATVMTTDNKYIQKHPKIKLLFLKTLLPDDEGRVEMAWNTSGRAETKFLRWSFTSRPEKLDTSKTIPIKVQVPEIKGVKLVCDEPERVMDNKRVVEYKIKAKKENDVEKLKVKIAILPPPGKKIMFNGYLREFSQSATPPVSSLNLNLQNYSPKTFIAGIAASKDIPVGTSSTFTVKASAIANKQSIEKICQLKVTVGSDFTEIFRKDHEFLLKVNYRVLSIVRGEYSILAISVENSGRKADSIKITVTQTIPVGWWAKPHHFKLKVNPDEEATIKMQVYAPPSASLGEGGILTIKAESRRDPTVVKIKQVAVKAISVEPEWRSKGE